jgi:hypothetical protein
MKRGCELPDGCSNLSDQVRLLCRDGVDLGFMTVAEALDRADTLNAELVLLTPDCNLRVFGLLEDPLTQRLRSKKET